MCLKNSLELEQYNKKKVGFPHYHWWHKGLEAYWEYLGNSYYPFYKNIPLDLTDNDQNVAIRPAAENGWGLKKEYITLETYIQREAAPTTPPWEGKDLPPKMKIDH